MFYLILIAFWGRSHRLRDQRLFGKKPQKSYAKKKKQRMLHNRTCLEHGGPWSCIRGAVYS